MPCLPEPEYPIDRPFSVSLPIVEVERLVVRNGQGVDADVRRRVSRRDGKVGGGRSHPDVQLTKSDFIGQNQNNRSPFSILCSGKPIVMECNIN